MPSLPRDLVPMLASRGEEPFDAPEYLFELKWSGVRALAYLERARLALVSQSGRDITGWFPELAAIAGQIKSEAVVLDGEIVALGPEGEPDLGLIAGRLSGGPVGDGVICLYQAFDLLYAGGLSFMERPLSQRKESLAKMVAGPGPAVSVDYVSGDGVALFEAAAARRLPGIVAKAAGSQYKPGRRSLDWIDIPVHESGWFVIGGYALGVGKEGPIAGLLLGEPVLPGRLRYAGMVRGNLPGAQIESALASLATDASPFLPDVSVMRLVYWLRPELVCEVRFARREADGRLRFPLFVTLRPDLAAKDLQAGSPGRSLRNS